MKPEQLLVLVARSRDKLNRYLLREFKNKGIEELSPSHGDILFVLASRKRATMRELANHIDRDKSTLTSLINKLEAGGYVVRTKDQSDSRITYIEATEDARRIKAIMFSISRELLRQIYSHFTDDEREELLRLLEKLLVSIPGE